MAVRCKATYTVVTATFVICCFAFGPFSWPSLALALLFHCWRDGARAGPAIAREDADKSDCSLAIRWSQTRIRPKIEAARLRLVEAHDVHQKEGCRVVVGVVWSTFRTGSADAWCRAPVLSELHCKSQIFVFYNHTFRRFPCFYDSTTLLDSMILPLLLDSSFFFFLLLSSSFFFFLLFSSRLEGRRRRRYLR